MKKVLLGVGVAVAALTLHAVSLDGEWDLAYRYQQEGGAWHTLKAHVPGDVYIDLERAGLIPDPMIGTNVFGLYTWEQCEWKYARQFARLNPAPGASRVQLCFEGVDTRAHYYLNGEKLGESANMFVPVTFDITEKMRDVNNLEVIIKSPLRDSNEPLGVLGRSREGGTDVEGIRKAQHMFGWDIMPRVVSSGIWKSVVVERVPDVRFADVHWMTIEADAHAHRARVKVDCRILAPWRYLHRARLRLTLSRNGKTAARAEHPIRYYQTRDTLTIPNAELWWPRDAGEPNLYDAQAEFIDEDGRVLAKDMRKIGLRTIKLDFAWWKSEAEPGTFRFRVNGEPIYMHGCDVTPMDALHSRDRAHQQKCLDMLVDLNCNMIRIWGGGVYEADSFYDFCDANGILVWQDFMMGNVEPEQNDAFAKAIYDEAKYQVMRLRSHPSLALWCGNNEQDRSVGSAWGEYAPDPAKERISREVLPRVLRDFDPITPYLPSSPLWTAETSYKCPNLPQDHLWGPRHLFYKGAYWCTNTPTFVSEMGCHGCPVYSTLERMFTPSGLYPWPSVANKKRFNDQWKCKAVTSYPERDGSGRNALMVHQVATLFGAVPDDLATFSLQSQTYQAMALKYWIELFRSRKGRMWGLLWWNLRDGWPILSDGVVDYWFGKRKAYDAIKSVQRPQLVTAVGEEPQLIAVNDRLYAVRGRVKATDVESGKVLFADNVEIPANGTCVLLTRIAVPAPRGMIRIDYQFENEKQVNRCLYGGVPFDWEKLKGWEVQ